MGGNFMDRFQPERYADEEPVTISWGGRSWGVPESLFARAQYLARAYDLHLLPMLEVYGTTRLNTQQSATLTEELMFIRDLVEDAALRPHLDSWISLALACSRDVRKTDLVIDGP